MRPPNLWRPWSALEQAQPLRTCTCRPARPLRSVAERDAAASNRPTRAGTRFKWSGLLDRPWDPSRGSAGGVPPRSRAANGWLNARCVRGRQSMPWAQQQSAWPDVTMLNQRHTSIWCQPSNTGPKTFATRADHHPAAAMTRKTARAHGFLPRKFDSSSGSTASGQPFMAYPGRNPHRQRRQRRPGLHRRRCGTRPSGLLRTCICRPARPSRSVAERDAAPSNRSTRAGTGHPHSRPGPTPRLR